MTIRKIYLLVVCLLAVDASLAAGKICRLVDPQGNVTFADCNSVEEGEEIKIKQQGSSTAPAAPTDRADKRKRIVDAMEEDRVKRKQAREKAAQEKQQQAQNCIRARDELRSYKEADYLYDLDEQGQRKAYSKEDKARITQELEAKIKKFCS